MGVERNSINNPCCGKHGSSTIDASLITLTVNYSLSTCALPATIWYR